MEQLHGQLRDGDDVLFEGPVYLASFDVAGVVSWCGLVVGPFGTFPPERRDLQLHLADGRSAMIAIVPSPGNSGRLGSVHFDVIGDWNQSAG